MTARKPPPHKRRWTRRDVEGLGVQTTVPLAGAVFGYSQTQAYEAVKAGTFPVPVIRCGRRIVVPVAPILAALGLEIGGEQIRSPAPGLRPGAAGERPGETGEEPRDGEATGPDNPAA
jgi:hypothetical protein